MTLELDHNTASAAGATANRPDSPRVQAGDRRLGVLQVLPALRDPGEVEQTVLAVATAVAEAGDRSVVASAGGPFVHTLTRGGAQHVELALESDNPLTLYKNGGKLADLIQAMGVDIIHAYAPGPAWSAWWATRRTGGAPLITTFYGLSPRAGRTWRRYARVMTWGKPVIAVSRFAAGRLNRDYGVPAANIRVVYPGIDVDRFDPLSVSTDRIVALAQRWRLQDGHSVVMVPGDLVPGKGHDVLLRAVSKLGRDDICCLFVGAEGDDGRYRRTIEDLAGASGLGGAVRIIERCDDMPAAYMLSDAVVCPSTEPQAFNAHIIEAQALALPVIGADHGGVREAIDTDWTGWLVTPNDADALSVAVERALALTMEERARLGEVAHGYVREHFSRETLRGRTLEIYRETADAARRR
jgi:glycosyltransferase involved in cell wall biosynthesis